MKTSGPSCMHGVYISPQRNLLGPCCDPAGPNIYHQPLRGLTFPKDLPLMFRALYPRSQMSKKKKKKIQEFHGTSRDSSFLVKFSLKILCLWKTKLKFYPVKIMSKQRDFWWFWTKHFQKKLWSMVGSIGDPRQDPGQRAL